MINHFSRGLLVLAIVASTTLWATHAPAVAQDDATQTVSTRTSDDQRLSTQLPATWATQSNPDELLFGENSTVLAQFESGDQDERVVGMGGMIRYNDAPTTARPDGSTPSAAALLHLLRAGIQPGVVFAEAEAFSSPNATDALAIPFESAGNAGRFYVLIFGETSATVGVYNTDADTADSLAASVRLGPTTEGKDVSYTSALIVNRDGDPLQLTVTIPEAWISYYDDEAETLHIAENQAVLNYLLSAVDLPAPLQGGGGSLTMFSSQVLGGLLPTDVSDVDAIFELVIADISADTVVGEPDPFQIDGFNALAATVSSADSNATLYVLLNEDVLVLASLLLDGDDRTRADGIAASIRVEPATNTVSAVPINPSDIALPQTATTTHDGLTAGVMLPAGWTFNNSTPDLLVIEFASDDDTLRAVQSNDLTTVTNASFSGMGASLNVFDTAFLELVLLETYSASAFYDILTNGVTELRFGDGVDFPVEGFSSGIRGPVLVNDAHGVMYVLLNENGAVVIIGLSADGDLSVLDAIAATASLTPSP